MPRDSLAFSLLLAARVLAAVRAGRSLTQALAPLAGEPASARAEAQDAAYATLRRYGCGEFLLRRLLARPLPHPEAEALLLAALYRLRSRPETAYVVVDQAVTAAAELAAGAFKGLVNAVLRNYLRQREDLERAMLDDEEARHQHPAWWLQRLRRGYPDCWQQIVAIANRPPPMTLRVNQRRCRVAEYVARLHAAGLTARPIGPAGLLLADALTVDAVPGFADGLVSIQDAGAQRAAELLAPQTGQRVLDACAAPGGKTCHLLELADIDLLALDVQESRVRRIRDNLHRLCLPATVVLADCRRSSDWWDGRAFDLVLADVPCSSSGVVRRHPDIKYLRRQSDIRQFVHLQREILDGLWPLLKAGGKMLYATCSLFEEENAAQIDAFLFRQAAARRVTEERWLPREEHDGFYYALLEKAA
ncbi:MAG: 16S rRNA (cytosine(967)-C(5))-methyltransferase RsmB [Candidatus Accumulibacter sp.]|nr:16S rRNA (cytosine(967)-C(5))-methyltransferase RsmB [Accumulibacter sp.]MCM8612151.1 16S rRNA (cytosine(967)-C(5))-methyltransferase RsmB [Accumulibacter sp.]MCM8635817.1 16S rRNA (cytosine(967)-C(5))-methyltransferase RsmB [Accumulibacter sp.]MCM8639546.1 16S rRNA (cytosine(967)-C(5))-methyltransferase RsmB [Accumulibacter sp.]